LLRLHDRKQASALWLAGSFVFAAIGYTQIMLVGGDVSRASPVIVQASLFGSHVMMVTGIATLYGRRFPLFGFGAPALLAFALVVWTMLDPSLFWLRVTVDFALMALANALCALFAARGRTHRIDWIIAGAFLFQMAAVTMRLGEFHLMANAITPQKFGAFHFTAAMQTANALYAIALAGALIARYFVSTFGDLARLADTDPLTGLLNRRAFEGRAETLRAASAPQSAGLIICDIDHFKRINDGYGHEAGDAALKAFADLIVRSAGPSAVCARLGGEEFCVLLPGATTQTTWLAAIRMRMATETLRVRAESGLVTMTASFGCLALAPGDDLRRAMASADAAMYQAKADGRNLVRQAGVPGAEQASGHATAAVAPLRVLDRRGPKG
jgi:diguanylate cyclase (GGDEF)-like protein